MQFCASQKYGASLATRAASEIKAQPLLPNNAPALGHFLSFFCSRNCEAMYIMQTIMGISKLHQKLWELPRHEVIFLQQPDSQIYFADAEAIFLEKSSKNCGVVPAV